MRTKITSLLLVLTLASCSVFGSLTSNTTIQPNDSFVLGNNKHGSFKVKLKNVSNHSIQVFMAPLEGGTHSPVRVNPNESVTVKTEKNTALIIENKSNEVASVDLYVTGDTGLSMGYQK